MVVAVQIVILSFSGQAVTSEAIIIYCRFDVPVRTSVSGGGLMIAAIVVPISAYDAVCRRVHTELLLRMVFDAADAKGRPTDRHCRQAGRKIEEAGRYGAISGRDCGVYGFSL